MKKHYTSVTDLVTYHRHNKNLYYLLYAQVSSMFSTNSPWSIRELNDMQTEINHKWEYHRRKLNRLKKQVKRSRESSLETKWAGLTSAKGNRPLITKNKIMPKNNGLLFDFIAVHYRRLDDPQYFARNRKPTQGCWRGFKSLQTAQSWLTRRSRKSAQSAQGRAVYANIGQMLKTLKSHDNDALKQAIRSYLRYARIDAPTPSIGLS